MKYKFRFCLTFQDRYTCASSVWSFAVTLWEVMCLAREKPFQHLTNEQVIQNAEVMYYGGELQVR